MYLESIFEKSKGYFKLLCTVKEVDKELILKIWNKNYPTISVKTFPKSPF